MTSALAAVLKRFDTARSVTVYSGEVLQNWLDQGPTRRAVPKPTRTRRTSVKRLVRELRATGERVVVEQDKDGTTRVLCGGEEENETPDSYWDRRLK
jgi:hypothetical protein